MKTNKAIQEAVKKILKGERITFRNKPTGIEFVAFTDRQTCITYIYKNDGYAYCSPVDSFVNMATVNEYEPVN